MEKVPFWKHKNFGWVGAAVCLALVVALTLYGMTLPKFDPEVFSYRQEDSDMLRSKYPREFAVVEELAGIKIDCLDSASTRHIFLVGWGQPYFYASNPDYAFGELLFEIHHLKKVYSYNREG